MARIALEFRKPFYQDWNRDFFLILLITLALETMLIFWIAKRPVPDYSEREIAHIQERFASFVLRETPRQSAQDLASSGGVSGMDDGDVTDEGAEEVSEGDEESVERGDGEAPGDGAGEGPGGTPEGGAARRVIDRAMAAEARRRTREAISGQVSNKGLLGLLTGTGSAATGDAVAGFTGLGDAGGDVGDLDNILSSVNGLKSGGSSAGIGGPGGGPGGGSIRGGRSGRQATIDDLVSDVETAHSSEMSRQGAMVVEAPSEVDGTARRSVARSANAIHEVLLGHVSAIRYCYERELKRNPELKGKITVRITVASDGTVSNAEIVSSTMNNSRVERCILARIRLWKDFKPIDSGEGEVTFRQTYTFGY